jgi:hypothetical protein
MVLHRRPETDECRRTRSAALKGLWEGVVHTSPWDRRKAARMVVRKAHNRRLQKQVAIFRFIFRLACKPFPLPCRLKVRN